jgi:uncharacterized membrane protein
MFFTLLNLENRCDFKFWVTDDAVFRNVPVYLTVFAAFAAGMLCAFPVMFLMQLRKKKRDKAGNPLGSHAMEGKKKGKKSRNSEEELGTPGAS